jgi:hypothetical protein
MNQNRIASFALTTTLVFLALPGGIGNARRIRSSTRTVPARCRDRPCDYWIFGKKGCNFKVATTLRKSSNDDSRTNTTRSRTVDRCLHVEHGAASPVLEEI